MTKTPVGDATSLQGEAPGPLVSATKPGLPWALALLAAAFAASGYLLFRTFRILAGVSSEAFDVCATVFGGDCDATLVESSSWELAVPLAGWGVVYFGALLALLLLGRGLGPVFGRVSHVAAVTLGIPGSVVSLVLLGLFAAGATSPCALCILIHGLHLTGMILLWRALRKERISLVRAWRGAFHWATGAVPETSELRQLQNWNALGLASVGLLTIVLFQAVLLQTERVQVQSSRLADPEEIWLAYQATREHDLAVGESSPRWGSSDAAVELVVFSSFACPACADFAEAMHSMMQTFSPDELTVVFKHYPNGRSCRASPEARAFSGCRAAAAAAAAHLQGRFVPFHDALFAQRSADEAAVSAAARQAGLDPRRFEADRTSPAAWDQVDSDIELGQLVGVDATPALFLNKKQITNATPEGLEALIARIARGG